MRSAGRAAGLTAFALDFLKGSLATWLALRMAGPTAAAAAAVTAGAAVFRAAAATDRRPPQRTAISCAPQSTQKAERCRRDAACFASLHGGLESCAFTTPPHCGQWLTGEFARR
jgi:hypothetical protein